MLWAGATMVTLSLLGVLTLVVTVWWYGRKAADVDPEVLLDYRPAQVTRVLARDGTVIGELVFEQRRATTSCRPTSSMPSSPPRTPTSSSTTASTGRASPGRWP